MKGSALLPVIVAGITPLLLLTLIVVGTGVELVGWHPPLLWADHFGTNSDFPPATSGATALAVDNSGLYVAGYLNLTNQLNTFVRGSAFLRRYELTGHEIWMRTVSNNVSSSLFLPANPVSKIALWSNHIYIAANINDSSMIMQYDSDGSRGWISQFGGPRFEIDGISVSSTGVYAIGRYVYTPSYSLIQQYDFSGKSVWNSTFRSSDYVLDLNAGPLGIYILTTGSLLKYDQYGNQVWTRPSSCLNCTPSTAISADNHGIYVADDGGVSKYATDGSVLWSANFQFPNTADRIESISISADSSAVYLFMDSYYPQIEKPPNSVFLAKYSSTGSLLWSYALPAQGKGWFGQTPYLSAYAGNLYLASSDGHALVEEYSGTPSLIFLGIDPPWSFVTLGATVAVIAIGLTLSIRRFIRKRKVRPRTVRPQSVSKMPSD